MKATTNALVLAGAGIFTFLWNLLMASLIFDVADPVSRSIIAGSMVVVTAAFVVLGAKSLFTLT